jgi:hypothetical protein
MLLESSSGAQVFSRGRRDGTELLAPGTRIDIAVRLAPVHRLKPMRSERKHVIGATRGSKMNNRAALDWLHFLLANVKDGLGPFLAMYLLASQHWDAGKIGVVMMIGGIATVMPALLSARLSTGRTGNAA